MPETEPPRPWDDCCTPAPDGGHSPGCPWVGETVRWSRDRAETETLTLAEFLEARIAEDEEQALASKASSVTLGIPPAWLAGVADRVLAECAAKRAIVEWHQSWPVLVEGPSEIETVDGDITSMTLRMSRQIAWLTQQEYRAKFGDEPPTTPMLRALAAVYSDHDEFRDEWRQ